MVASQFKNDELVFEQICFRGTSMYKYVHYLMYIKYNVLLVAFQGLNDKLVFAEMLNREFLGLMTPQLKK